MFIFLYFILIGSIFTALASTPERFVADLDSSMEAFEAEHRLHVQKKAHELNNYIFRNKDDFSAWCENRRQQFDSFKQRITAIWGYFLEPSGKCWVEYGKDSNSVSIVDFETGVVTVEVLVSNGTSAEQRRRAIKGAVARTVT
ncbi:MAG: DUF3393 domain-containing protein, partial [Chitinivibrionales bacterium]|nr:DUF3393 domain-containing protein [Chitinivibrionales bacterium]MBD3358637.1 DUF3393 domain-containing protein [Chitinivibrionales bacterium]